MDFVNHVPPQPAGPALLGAGTAVELGVGHSHGGGLGVGGGDRGGAGE